MEEPYGPRTRRWRRGYAAAAGSVLALDLLWRATGWGGPRASDLFANLVMTGSAFLAGALALRRSGRMPLLRRTSWVLIGLAATSWGLGNLAWMALSSDDGSIPFPSLADVGYLLLLPLLAFALLGLLGQASVTSRVRTLLDGLLILSAFSFASYALFLRPMLHYAGQQPSVAARVLAIAYPLGDLFLLALLILLASRTTRAVRRTLGWLGLAIACLTLADLGFWYSTAHDAYTSGQWTSAGYVAAFLVLGYAGLRPIARLPPAGRDQPGVFLNLLPLLPFVFSTTIAMMVQVTEGHLDAVLFWNAIVVVGTLALRQSVMLVENVRLREDVERALGELRALEQERTRSLRALGHDLQNPLTPIQIQTSLLRQRASPEDERAFAIIDRNLRHMRRLLDDLQDVARIQGAGLRLDPSDVDVAALAREVVDNHHDQAEERGVSLDVEGAGPVPARADPVRLRQVLGNLVQNALKFTPRGGSVRVGVRGEGHHVLCEVVDTGRGLRAEDAARLFRPFSQVHDTGDQEAEDRGTGLGLSICKGLVEAHGGTIGVRSEGPGRGATFWFRIPLEPPAQPATTNGRP